MDLSKSSPIYRLAAAALAFSLSGCASVVHGTRQEIEVHTDPPGALASAEGQSVTTPGVLILSRKQKDAEIRIEKDGLRPEVVRLNRSLSGALWWNLVLMPAGAAAAWAATPEESGLDDMFEQEENGVVAALIFPLVAFGGDFLVGGAYRLDPPSISITLVPLADGNPLTQAVQQYDGMTYRAKRSNSQSAGETQWP